MNTPLSLNTAILSFAFSGVLAPHRHDNTCPRDVLPSSAKPAVKKK
ncbi:MAG: hypothetical protein P4M09_06965 [Devosia sp.]|nr:hypothetical protein [Devosia sp.]